MPLSSGYTTMLKAVPWLRPLVAGHSWRGPRFNPRPGLGGYVVVDVTVVQGVRRAASLSHHQRSGFVLPSPIMYNLRC